MDDHFLVFATKNGVVKKTRVSAFSNPRVTGIRAINIDEGDELIKVCHSDGDSDIILATKHGKAIRFDESKRVNDICAKFYNDYLTRNYTPEG